MEAIKYNNYFKTKKAAREFLAALRDEGYDIPVDELVKQLGIETKLDAYGRKEEQKLSEKKEKAERKAMKETEEKKKKVARLEKKDALNHEVRVLKGEFPDIETDEVTDELNMGALRGILKILKNAKKVKRKEEAVAKKKAKDEEKEEKEEKAKEEKAKMVVSTNPTNVEEVLVSGSHDEIIETTNDVVLDDPKAMKKKMKELEKAEKAKDKAAEKVEKSAAAVSKKLKKRAEAESKKQEREAKKDALKQEIEDLKNEHPDIDTDEVTDKLNMGELKDILKILNKGKKKKAKEDKKRKDKKEKMDAEKKEVVEEVVVKEVEETQADEYDNESAKYHHKSCACGKDGCVGKEEALKDLGLEQQSDGSESDCTVDFDDLLGDNE